MMRPGCRIGPPPQSGVDINAQNYVSLLSQAGVLSEQRQNFTFYLNSILKSLNMWKIIFANSSNFITQQGDY